jgi:predicted DNA-binding transcriptional regulator AlpA
MEITKEYLNEKEVSQMTGRALSTLRNERSLGKGLPYVKFGRSVRYPRADLVSFLEARKIHTSDSRQR